MAHRTTFALVALTVSASAATSFAQPSATFLTGHAEPEVVTMYWTVQGPVELVRAYRRDAAGAAPWAVIADTLVLAGETAYLEDRAVVPGARYDYRLGLVLAGLETFSAPVRMFVPRLSVQAAVRRTGLVPNGLEIEWATMGLGEVFVERRFLPQGVFVRLGATAPDDEGVVRWSDFEPEPADSVEYQLVAGSTGYGAHRLQVPEPRAEIRLLDPDSRSVRLAWQAFGKASDASIQRREAGESDWTTIGYRVLDEHLRCEFHDGPVYVGRTYQYRVGLDGSRERQWSGEVEVTIPAPIAFATRAAWDAAAATLALEVRTPVNAVVGFVLFDAFGRRQRELALRLDEGEHHLRLPLPGLMPGVYYLQSRVHGLVATARFALWR